MFRALKFCFKAIGFTAKTGCQVTKTAFQMAKASKPAISYAMNELDVHMQEWNAQLSNYCKIQNQKNRIKYIKAVEEYWSDRSDAPATFEEREQKMLDEFKNYDAMLKRIINQNTN